MSMKRVPGCASTTLSAPPAPRTAICERLARRVLAPKLTSPSSLALPELVFADPFRVPHAAARSELQERSGLQPRALHRATWTGAVAGTGLARHQVPQVVEPAVGVLGIHARPLGCDGNDGLMDEDEGVYLRIRDGPRRQGLEDIEAHHGANVGVLEQNYLPLSGLDLRAHCALLLSLESTPSCCPWSALPKSSRCGCTRCRRRARSPSAHSGTAMHGPRACARLTRRYSGLRAG